MVFQLVVTFEVKIMVLKLIFVYQILVMILILFNSEVFQMFFVFNLTWIFLCIVFQYTFRLKYSYLVMKVEFVHAVPILIMIFLHLLQKTIAKSIPSISCSSPIFFLVFTLLSISFTRFFYFDKLANCNNFGTISLIN